VIRLMLIPEGIDMARAAVAGGVDRIFIDLERAGKYERQGGGTWISTHGLEEVSAYRKALPDTELMVRIDPWPKANPADVEQIITAGADLIMLPMIEDTAHVTALSKQVAGRTGIIPLIETAYSASATEVICGIEGVTEIFVGLNDLHRQLGHRFIFEPLSDGLIDDLCATALGHGKPFGFGGMAQIGHGDLPSELILGEHIRMGSSAVILSRKFKGEGNTGDDFDWAGQISRIRDLERGYAERSAEAIERDHLAVISRINAITARLKAAS
jgi:2-keto-3-deoxy-L-rhamnonate aldolase RhmA